MERVAETVKHEPSPAITGHGRPASPAAASLPPGLELQQLAGNQAMQQLLRSGFIQAKLAISNPDDPEEREADQVASTIMRKAAGAPCSCSPGEEMCEECQQKQSAPAIQRRASAPAAPSYVPRIVSDVLRSPGYPLDASTRAFFEPRFGHDFSNVRVHTDSHAADSARSINAHAYTAGSDIAFAPGQYSPATDSGRSLLAHELTHVTQQTGRSQIVQRAPSDHSAEIERSRVSPGRVAKLPGFPGFSLYNFAINQSDLKQTHLDLLDELAQLSLTIIAIELGLSGHTDSTGDETINEPLSANRAMAVADYLANAGLVVRDVSSHAATQPVADNSTEIGRNRNRRVDILWKPPSRIPPKKPDDNQPQQPERKDKPPDSDSLCEMFPMLCAVVGVGLVIWAFCTAFPEVCALIGLPWPWGGGDGDGDGDGDKDKDKDKKKKKEKKKLPCGDPQLPLTHVEYIPASGDKGDRMEARPLTRCEGNKHGSPAKRNDPNWPHGWDCVVQSGQSNLWRRAHLLHGPDLHGPGNERENIIIADSSINGGMYHSVEKNAIERVWDRDEVLYYEVQVNHFTGPYPRPYFAESVHMKYGTLDPLTGVKSPPIFDNDIPSSVGHQPPNCTTPPPPGPTPTPTPSDDDKHEPSVTPPPCDRAELARRVNACVEEARQATADCTPDPSGGWEGVLKGIGYLLCLEKAKKRLLECDRQAKADTHCPDAPAPSAPTAQRNDSFDSTLEICRRLLNSRTFHVSGGTLEVEIDANWFDSIGTPADRAACPMTKYHVSLEKAGMVFDSEIATGDVAVAGATRLTWSSLEAGEYYLTIWTNNENPNCCLKGRISVRLPRSA